MKRIALLLLVLFSLVCLQLPALAADPPVPSPNSQFYVLDLAEVLDTATEQTIVQTSAALAQKTRAQVVVVTVKSLQEYPPEEYALAILRQWGIGDKQLNSGVLLLVSPQERVSRIEVGYGLEGALPDGKTGRLQDEYMIPYFQQNDYNQGILNGYLAIAQEVAKEYNVALEIKEPRSMPRTSERGTTLPWWANLLIVIVVIALLILDNRYLGGFFTGMLIGMLMRGGGRRGGGGGGFGGFGGSGGGGGSTRRW